MDIANVPSHVKVPDRLIGRIALLLAALASAAALIPSVAGAAYTSSNPTPPGTSATMTGVASDDDFLSLHAPDAGPSVFEHNRDGDPNFFDEFDFDTGTALSQTLPLTGNLTVNAGAGFDEINLNSEVPLANLTGALTFNGGAPTPPGNCCDNLSIANFADDQPRALTFGATSITGLGGGSLTYEDIECLNYDGGQGADRITLVATLPCFLSIFAGDGDDTFLPYNDFFNGDLSGGSGTDTVDLSPTTRGRFADLGQGEQFFGDLQPSTGSTAGGGANLFLDRDSGNFFLDASVCGIDVAGGDITGSHLHAANGDVIFDVGSNWGGDSECGGTFAGGVPFPSAHLAALRAGDVSFDVHTNNAFPQPELRGQLEPQGFRGFVTGFGVANIQRLLLGAGDDIAVGTEDPDVVHGGAGADVLTGAGGGDQLDGASGQDTLAGGAGGDALNAADGGTVDQVRCGDGVDTVVADDVDTVAADCENVTRIATRPPGQAQVVTPPDLTPPVCSVAGLRRSMSRAAFFRGFRFSVTCNERTRIAVRAFARLRRVLGRVFTSRAGDLTLAERRLGLGTGRRSVRVRPSRRFRRSLGRSFRARVQIDAFDASGNRRTVRRRISVR